MTRARHPELHANVLAAPNDDEPRLVYADWLTERGDPWGELISVQIIRTRRDSPELAARESQLRELVSHPRGVYRRGFVEKLYCGSDQLDTMLIDTCVRELRIGDDERVREQGARLLAALPRMRLRSLRLGTMVADDLASLCDALGEALEVFSYGWGLTSVSREDVAAMTGSRLRVPSLDLHGLRADAFATLAEWHPLRSLSLERSDLGPGVLEHYVGSRALARLEHLDLSYTNLGDRDVDAIAGSSMPLVSLGLTGNALTPAAAARIASTPRFAALRRLRIADAGIDHEGLEALLASPYLSREMVLCLDAASLGFSYVAESSGNLWEEPGNPALVERIEARFRIEGDGLFIRREP